jgi:6-phosphogluconolactonase
LRPDLHIVDDPAAAVGELLAEQARAGGSIVLTGGSTPAAAYRHAAELQPDWSDVTLWWGDERCVPPDDADSNYHMAYETLLSRVPIPPRNVHRVPTEIGAPVAVAAHYERELRGHFGLEVEDVPVFDLLLLGMGPDGHTASLFPGGPAVDETRRLVVPSEIAYMPHSRVTFTLPVLNAARAVAFLVTGRDKAPALAKALAGDPSVPAGRVRPAGELRWYLDRAAAGQ